jgi:hypothetical protein
MDVDVTDTHFVADTPVVVDTPVVDSATPVVDSDTPAVDTDTAAADKDHVDLPPAYKEPPVYKEKVEEPEIKNDYIEVPPVYIPNATTETTSKFSIVSSFGVS